MEQPRYRSRQAFPLKTTLLIIGGFLAVVFSPLIFGCSTARQLADDPAVRAAIRESLLEAIDEYQQLQMHRAIQEAMRQQNQGKVD